ncbi:response regulator transcription factor [Actinomyces viscosus]|uniref:Nitrogen regulation protein C n=1 Tax=Actinomyces viscosus TaxID=1656 RepID=A0A448PJ28_ACTVI|nr:response regulator transcription factor [Actinomyces viscosus]TFH53946.1 response regulator transcription factor [Actinomyces viscosus]VEI14908.1 Nitrogen regulation protein C [Actinomyces viscosus]
MTPAAIRVAVVDDQPLLVSAFSALVGAQPDMEVVLEAVNGRQGVDRLTAQALEPRGGADLVLMDLRMPVMDGVSAIRELRATPATSALRILVLTTFDDDELVLAALGAGAHGFLLKDAEPTTLLEAIRVVARGGSWLDPAVTGTVLAHLDTDGGSVTGTGDGTLVPRPPTSPAGSTGGAVPVVGAPSGPYEPLTGREDAVLALVCQGLSNARIGERLHVAESTVKSHVKTILGKTGCHNRVELVIYALTTGLVQPQ